LENLLHQNTIQVTRSPIGYTIIDAKCRRVKDNGVGFRRFEAQGDTSMPESAPASAPAQVTASASTSGCPDADASSDAAASARKQMDEVMDSLASELYNMSSMLVGEGEEGVRLVEVAIDSAEVSACQNPKAARKSARRALAKAAVASLAVQNPAAFEAPEASFHPTTCIEDDELESVGVSVAQLEAMFSGPERERIRHWLAQLEPAVRTVFILRAVASITGDEAATILAEFGGPQAAGWQPEAVRHVFRQGLCSLTAQLIHDSAVKP
jgi:hypothetical protein